jgi:pimeloyl-ACP methyl ester carboxylesterase
MAMLLIGKFCVNLKLLKKEFLIVFSSLWNRRAICKKLREELKYDVFIFDYRGFGDSTGEPTEEGLIRDARYVYDWLHNATNGQRKIYIWGQSLGSAVACQLAARLSDDESMEYHLR